jgi:hypothetical protein
VDTGVPQFKDRLADAAVPLTDKVVKKEPDVKGLNVADTTVFRPLFVCVLLPAKISGVFAVVIFIP